MVLLGFISEGQKIRLDMRKKCAWCGGVILPTELYSVLTYRHDSFDSVYLHSDCHSKYIFRKESKEETDIMVSGAYTPLKKSLK